MSIYQHFLDIGLTGIIYGAFLGILRVYARIPRYTRPLVAGLYQKQTARPGHVHTYDAHVRTRRLVQARGALHRSTRKPLTLLQC